MDFGFSTNAFREYSLPEAIHLISEAGFDGVELLFDEPHIYPPEATPEDREEVKDALAAAGVEISNCNAFMLTAIEDFHHPSFIEVSDDYRRRRIDYTHDALSLAAAFDFDYISIEPGGPIPESKSRAWAMDRFVDALDELAVTAEAEEVHILVEPEPDLLIETSTEFLDLMERVDSDYVGCNFDAGHLFCVGEDPAELVESLAPYTMHYHVEDIPDSREHHHTKLGDGAMDVDGFLTAVEDSGYDGWVTVELYPYEETAAETARDSFEYLDEHGWV